MKSTSRLFKKEYQKGADIVMPKNGYLDRISSEGTRGVKEKTFYDRYGGYKKSDFDGLPKRKLEHIKTKSAYLSKR